MKCRVGIDNESPEWKLVLQQIGVSWSALNLYETIPAGRFPVVIITKRFLGDSEKKTVGIFMSQGGAVLTNAVAAENILGEKKVRTRIRYLMPDDRLNTDAIADLGGYYTTTVQSNSGMNQSGCHCIKIANHLNGKIIVLPDNIIGKVLTWNYAHRYFYRENGPRYPMEIVSGASKGVIRRLVQNALMHLFHSIGLPFVTLSPSPFGKNPLFLFRIDTDYSSQNQLKTFHEALEDFGFMATWFIETKTQAGNIRQYKDFAGHELAYHCYRHRTFRSSSKNEADFRKGLHLLEEHGIKPSGYAAPQGIWTPALAETIERFGFEYSSEFSLGYDDLPFRPYLNGNLTGTMQIPVHPVSTGRLLQARLTEKEMIRYYYSQVDRQLSIGEPLVLYDHPAHGQHEVFRKVFEKIRSHSFANMRMLDYARWWKKRNSAVWSVSYESKNIEVETENQNDTLSLNIQFPNSERYEIQLSSGLFGAYHLIPYRKTLIIPEISFPSHQDLKKTRKTDVRLLYHTFLFHYRRMKQ